MRLDNSRASAGGAPAPRRPAARTALARLQAHLFERRRPRVGVDQHQRGLGHAGTDAARPDEFPERPEPHALVEELLDLVEYRLALAPIGLPRLLPVERVDVRVGAARVRAIARHL